MARKFRIYYTSDTHGHIFPVNYAGNCPEDSGLLNICLLYTSDAADE